MHMRAYATLRQGLNVSFCAHNLQDLVHGLPLESELAIGVLAEVAKPKTGQAADTRGDDRRPNALRARKRVEAGDEATICTGAFLYLQVLEEDRGVVG